MTKLAVGDYVIADHAQFDDFTGITWKIVGFSRNLFREPLVKVAEVAGSGRTVFYPSELSFEDGSQHEGIPS